jgi:hypothetical protein
LRHAATLFVAGVHLVDSPGRKGVSVEELLRLLSLEYFERVGFLDLIEKGSIFLCELQVVQNLKRV